MAGLILKLRPFEELMINGVVVENGDRNARIRVKTEGAHILRMREAMKPEEATTPEKRAYYLAQLAVAGQLPQEEAQAHLTIAVTSLFSGAMRRDLLDLIEKLDFYQIMRRLKPAVATTPTQQSMSA